MDDSIISVETPLPFQRLPSQDILTMVSPWDADPPVMAPISYNSSSGSFFIIWLIALKIESTGPPPMATSL
jgi:hypothetical protein